MTLFGPNLTVLEMLPHLFFNVRFQPSRTWFRSDNILVGLQVVLGQVLTFLMYELVISSGIRFCVKLSCTEIVTSCYDMTL